MFMCCVLFAWCVFVFILHVLVVPLRSDWVLMEKSRGPRFVSSLLGLSSLSFLKHKLLLSGLQLVPIHDCTGHMLPQSVRGIRSNCILLFLCYLSKQNQAYRTFFTEDILLC